MKDPIERRDVLNLFDSVSQYMGNWLIQYIEDGISSISSAQSEIILCKDCKWSDWYTSADGKRYCYCMETGNGGRTENDFCSYAERKTDESD